MREQARRRDRETPAGPLHGVPVGVKDVIDTADMPTGYGSDIYRDHRPQRDAACVTRLRAAGALIMGKTVTTEFAFQRPGKTRNPRAPAHTPGGSSSGSAAAVADAMVPAALGTQTGGSVIRPAAFCGAIGYKPAFDRIPTAGLKYLSPGLDTVGFMVRSLDDIGLLMRVLADLDLAHPEREAPRLALCRTGHWAAADAAAQALLAEVGERAAVAGAGLREVELPPEFSALDATHRTLLGADMAVSLAREMGEAGDRLSDSIRRFIESSREVSPAEIDAGWKRVRACRERLGTLFAADEIVLTPSAPGEAPAGLETTGDAVFNRAWTMLHLPCLHLPVGDGPGGLPLGVQLVAPHGDEAALLGAARWLARRLDLALFG